MDPENQKIIDSSSKIIITLPQLVAFIIALVSVIFAIAMDFKENVRHIHSEIREDTRKITPEKTK